MQISLHSVSHSCDRSAIQYFGIVFPTEKILWSAEWGDRSYRCQACGELLPRTLSQMGEYETEHLPKKSFWDAFTRMFKM